jgi:ABC-type multidrug transport system fused ATPase/permease subunit
MKIKFSYVMLALALIVAGCAGYFSVWGLSQLFAGASTAVIIMATGLEVGKIVTTTALHRYWKKIASGLKIYLTISVGVLMLITSAGIYGFLSNAYQKTANKLEIQNGQVSVMNGKKDLFQKGLDENQKIIDQKNKRIGQLSELRRNQESRLDAATNNRNRNGARADIQGSNDEIQKLTNDIDALNVKNASLSDSISKYNTQVLELNANSEVASEVGPLKYISELTGTPMAKVVNILILLLIFVFDPLAVALVLMTNRIFEIEGEDNPLEPKEEPKKLLVEQPEPQSLTRVIEANDAINEPITDAVLPDEQHDDADVIIEEVSEEVNEVITDQVSPEPIIEEVKEPHREPVIPTGSVKLEDIKEVKNRNYSVNVPHPKSNNNTIERIGSNKMHKNGDNDTLYFKRGQ